MSNRETDKLNNGLESTVTLSDKYPVIIEWLQTIKSNSLRFRDVINDKKKAVIEFFDWINKPPELIQQLDVKLWAQALLRKGLSDGTIYNRLSAISNYFEFLLLHENFKGLMQINPVKINIAGTPKKYLPKNIKPLSQKELVDLLAVVKKYSVSGDPLYLRDYAILQLFTVTGRAREEILGLECQHIKMQDNSLILYLKVNGGRFLSCKLNDKISQTALFNYLESTGRNQTVFSKQMPLWLRHGVGGKSLQKLALTSGGFAKRMKLYAEEAGIRNFHIHLLRHTYALIITEEFPNLDHVHEALGNVSLESTTRYVKKLKCFNDDFSSTIRRITEKEKQ